MESMYIFGDMDDLTTSADGIELQRSVKDGQRRPRGDGPLAARDAEIPAPIFVDGTRGRGLRAISICAWPANGISFALEITKRQFSFIDQYQKHYPYYRY
jgi:hypothetical protein